MDPEHSKHNWYVITGASCSGKTTLASALEERGYRVVHEVARTFIDDHMAQGETVEDIRKDEPLFQKKVLEMKIKIERDLDKDQLVFFDRGIPDTCAYDTLHQAPPNPILDKASKECKYKKVFLLDQLPFTEDYARTETKEQQDQLHGLLKETCRRLGFPIIEVPVLPIEERVDFVLRNL